jgi:RNA polymerase sigma-70 factor (ECF subfamily)
LCRFLSFYTQNAQAVEDIVQEVFLSLWENRNTVEISHIKTYLFQSARNRMLNYLRDEKNRSVLLEQWFEEQMQMRNKNSGAGNFDTGKLLKSVEKAIESLPRKCKEIFILNKIEELSYKKIAETKGISIKTVENQMGIALKKIRQFLSENILSQK